MSVAQVLRSHAFARALSEAQLATLEPCARVLCFAENAVIFREGGEANVAYLITGGRVALEQHVPGKGDVQLENLVGGDMLGLSWLSPGGRWQLDARAVEPTEAVVLDGPCLRAHMESDTNLHLAVARYLVGELHRRLERVRLQRLDVYAGKR